ncbi:MAG TPA: SRPBCC family protein [Verrucomicrobiota bacterium]|nr:SRPBCC family protein [Verrucomicrobiota bacterium]HRT58591.1 SRPBCC family protein [Candidatus Paceibacterota bacterium]
MHTFSLRTDLWLPRPIQEVFRFFADAGNLQTITPPWLSFEILTPLPILMRPGAVIDYRLRLHGFPIRWQTEITAWEPPFRFVDEQRRGPYLLWIHEHRFEPLDGGTRVEDYVRYRPPGGWLVERLFVRRDVTRIFAFRRQKLQELFADSSSEKSTA